jgi:hypothetical protein
MTDKPVPKEMREHYDKTRESFVDHALRLLQPKSVERKKKEVS